MCRWTDCGLMPAGSSVVVVVVVVAVATISVAVVCIAGARVSVLVSVERWGATALRAHWRQHHDTSSMFTRPEIARRGGEFFPFLFSPVYSPLLPTYYCLPTDKQLAPNPPPAPLAILLRASALLSRYHISLLSPARGIEDTQQISHKPCCDWRFNGPHGLFLSVGIKSIHSQATGLKALALVTAGLERHRCSMTRESYPVYFFSSRIAVPFSLCHTKSAIAMQISYTVCSTWPHIRF